MKTISILILTVLFSAVTASAQREPLQIPDEVKPLVEAGARPIALGSADLNGDGRKDYVLVLEREHPSKMDQFDYPTDQRPLLILVRDANNTLSEAKRNETMVMCSTCGGVMGDPFVGVKVGRNTFTVNHYGGSAWRWSADYKFNYSRIDKTWQLVRIEKTTFHAADQNRTMTRKVMVPPRDFGKVDLADFDPTKYDDPAIRGTASSAPADLPSKER